MVQMVSRSVLVDSLGIMKIASTKSSGQLLGKGLVLSELVENGLMQKVLNVLGVVEGDGSCGSLVGLLLASGLSRVDTLEDTEPSEVGKRDL